MNAETKNTKNGSEESPIKSNFIRTIIDEDLASGKHTSIVTRFPPEPNGYLHIGHAKSICLNFGIATDYNGRCHLRLDDTNPEKESEEYVKAIKKDISWLGFDWGEHEYFASNYFDRLYKFAIELIKAGKAYVDSLSADEIREYRGTLKEPGKESPYRSRSIEENMDLFTRMRDGEFEDGEHVLRAKIDMAAPNVLMRDPTIYRIRKVHHHNTGDKWCIYPMYDFAHCLSDSIEGITHSICTLEFENNRELYDWIIDNLETQSRPRQYEFARLNLTHTVMSKRKLIRLVEEGVVDGWDDPRLPTISGLRRRGVTPAAIRNFCDRIGVAKADNLVEYAMFEHAIREDLNASAPRYMAVLNPLKVVITNYPEDQVEAFDFPNHPEDESHGKRPVPFSRELYIEQDDFMEDAPKKFFRLAPGREVRLRYAYYIKCEEVIKDDEGNVTELRCTYDPDTKGGWSEDGRKVKGTLHWVSIPHAKEVEVRLYDHLFTSPTPGSNKEVDFLDEINPDSLKSITGYVEPAMVELPAGSQIQFERVGYFCVDTKYSKEGAPVFNRTSTLRDTWAKVAKKK